MILECNENPDKLIDYIGDPYFSVCDEDWDECYRHKDHPRIIRIADCELGSFIDIELETPEQTRLAASSLCKILNQNYKEIK